jgi:putrescine aminotransferase
MMKRGVIAAYTLNNPRVIRMEPPFLVTDEQIEHAVSCLKESVAETADLISAFA